MMKITYKKRESMCICDTAMIYTTEQTAFFIFIGTIFLGPLATLVAGLIDEKGINFNTIGLAIIQGILAYVIVGWIWAIYFGLIVMKSNKGNNWRPQ